MNTRSFLIVLAFAGVRLGYPTRAGAHRLDEYLQAARLSVERNRVDLEIDLTAGVSVAPMVFSLIDANSDGRISSAEGKAYAQQVLSSISLSVDGVPVSLTLADEQFPEYLEMSQGVGMIRLRGSAQFPTAAVGRHEVFYRNTHQAEISVYLANALVPVDKQIEITGQRRDSAQHELTIDYRVIPESPWTSAWWVIAGLAVASVLVVTMRQVRD